MAALQAHFTGGLTTSCQSNNPEAIKIIHDFGLTCETIPVLMVADVVTIVQTERMALCEGTISYRNATGWLATAMALNGAGNRIRYLIQMTDDGRPYLTVQ